MRLWHYALLPYLPKSQLLAQKRECDLIWKDNHNKKQTNHILINYIYKYDIEELETYYTLLQDEFRSRGITFNSKCRLLMFNLGLSYENHYSNVTTMKNIYFAISSIF